MLNIVVLDRSAESRNRIARQINDFLQSDFQEGGLLPRVSIKPLSRHEIKFHSAPDICIIGEEILQDEITDLHNIRKLLPDSALLVRTPASLQNLATIEQLARLGADDTMQEDITPREFLKKLIMLSRKTAKAKSGKLIIVDSGKGGVGVSSVSAAMAESLIDQGKKVALLDFDFETQDLSRFLQVRPYINENLQLLLNGNRPITEEFVNEALVQVWHDEPKLFCMPPVAESEDLYDGRAPYAKTLMSVLEILDSTFDCVIVDTGCARGAILKTLYRLADKVLFLVNNDPATLYSAVDRVSKMRFLMSPHAQMTIADNGSFYGSVKTGLSHKLLKEEFLRASKLPEEAWSKSPIPFSSGGSRWPGSGMTLFSQAKGATARSLTKLNEELELTETSVISQGSSSTIFNQLHTGSSRLIANLMARKEKPEAPRAALPDPAPRQDLGLRNDTVPRQDTPPALPAETTDVKKLITSAKEDTQPQPEKKAPALETELSNIISGARVA